MTLIFNSDKYANLLSQYQPRLIRTEEENNKALAIIEELMHCPDRSLEEDELYELLITLIEKFEQDYYSPGKASSPYSLLLFLMEQRNLKQSDLVDAMGSEEVVLEAIAGNREINQPQAKALGRFFQVDPSLFLT